MKVCILSMQRVPNMGSLLQSYALKRILESLGNDVSFIDIQRIDEDYAALEGRYIRVENNKGKFDRAIQKIRKIDRYTIQRIINKKKAKEQRMLFKQFSENTLCLDVSENEEHFDLCVIGSDEVFNCCSYSPWGLTSQLFGNVRQADHVISYAASCGFTTVEMLSDKAKSCISNALSKLEGVSVRDANTYSFVRNLGVSDATTNLDPVLIYDFDSELSSTSLPDDFPDNACIVYAYYDRIQNPAEIRSIRAFCKKNNLVLVAVGAPQMWISRYYPLSPFQVLKAISSAEFVVTDTFHGTIFSAKYAKNFAVILRENNSNKLSDLLRRLGIKEQLVENGRTLEEISLTEVNREIINQIISIEREHTTEYLTYHLSACQ